MINFTYVPNTTKNVKALDRAKSENTLYYYYGF